MNKIKVAILGSANEYFNRLLPMMKSNDLTFIPFIEPKASIDTFDRCVLVYDPEWDKTVEYNKLCIHEPFNLYIYDDDTKFVSQPSWSNGKLNLDNPSNMDIIINGIRNWTSNNEVYSL